MRSKRSAALLFLAALSPALLGACATRPPADDPDAVAEFKQNNDPIEPFNRGAFAVHQAIDRNVLAPVARGYRAVVPEECVADKHESPHFANLYDIAMKYGDVVPVAEVLDHLRGWNGPS